MSEKELREKILSLTKEYASIVNSNKKFIPGKTVIPFAAHYFDEEEYINLVDAALDAWLTTRRWIEEGDVL
jgi:CDP-6-deoxy-D-xylo-4-hexulose-3-dehydrase